MMVTQSNRDVKNFAMKIDLKKHLSSEILYILIGIIAVVFLMFWLIGYDRPYEDDPNFTAPLFIDLLLVTMLIIFAFAIVSAVWSVVRFLKVAGRGEKYNNNIPVRRVGTLVAVGTFLALLATFLTGSTEPMTINGSTYNDVLGLRLANMFIGTSMLMIAAAVALVVYFSVKNVRR